MSCLLGQSYMGYFNPLVFYYQWEYLRSPAKNLVFCRVSKIGNVYHPPVTINMQAVYIKLYKQFPVIVMGGKHDIVLTTLPVFFLFMTKQNILLERKNYKSGIQYSTCKVVPQMFVKMGTGYPPIFSQEKSEVPIIHNPFSPQPRLQVTCFALHGFDRIYIHIYIYHIKSYSYIYI